MPNFWNLLRRRFLFWMLDNWSKKIFYFQPIFKSRLNKSKKAITKRKHSSIWDCLQPLFYKFDLCPICKTNNIIQFQFKINFITALKNKQINNKENYFMHFFVFYLIFQLWNPFIYKCIHASCYERRKKV